MNTITFILIFFAGLSFLEIALAWRFLGLCLSIVGVIAIYKRSLLLGIEDQPSTIKVKGVLAVLLGALMLTLGGWIILEPSSIYSMFGFCDGSCEKVLR